MRFIFYLIAYLMLFFSSILKAQTTQKQPCSGEKYSQFDFWQGSWKVYDTKGKLIGTNKLIKMQSNCVMQENWESKTSSNKGTSYNYYNKTDDSWNQVWVDNTGFSLVLIGNLIDGKMVLKSELIKTKKGNYYNRVIWSKNTDGSVTQVWDYLNEKGKVISEAFRGIYKKS
ncbi:hypothetical protein [Polaribacter porphyrae]|uniref:Ricin B lectin domain-containing protein n=1 Tax=Polaribacter porphyrae TaxID=1137780 RepID=A0A2S7WT44_9FLAO|nr:hypothetical protein [Polaribacter porphyrae]PQJ80763.1 hypothetical protein BTO18_16995 [Polaribacter porphyrae]